MKKLTPPTSSFKSESQRTIEIRTTLFDLFTALNEEARVGGFESDEISPVYPPVSIIRNLGADQQSLKRES